ncbi:PqqD family protein [Geoalkalibacter sp.]|uniref:PqqD family protein n=1 Tax=Geoalkalibacter sp. TaxID=3041440 RepID=UPI00272E581C|nr:PqqD family protein [Geoalkalibacter sp.]
MTKEVCSIARRKFIRNVGAGLAVATLTTPGLAQAGKKAAKMPSIDFEFAILDPIPLIPRERIYEHNRNSVRLFKNAEAKEAGTGLELNSMAAMIAQMCDGTRNVDMIIEATADIFYLDEAGLRPRVAAFLQQLFEDGYLVFASPATIPQEKRVRGMTLLTRKDSSIKILADSREIKF